MAESPVQLSRFRADLSSALMRRGNRLLQAKDLRARVQSMEPLEAYLVVKELGVEDAQPILRHATSEQIRAFIDLDCWAGDRPDTIEVDAWLAPFSADGKEPLARAFSLLESEVQILFLKHSLRIFDSRSEDIPPALKHTPRMTTPDGLFVIDVVLADKLEINVLALLDGLYSLDLQDTFQLITAAKWETASPLEERAFRFRSGRLQDLGFPAPDEAHAIFASPPDSPPPRAAPVPTTLPALYASSLEMGTLLTRAMARIAEVSLLEAAESDLVYLINAAIIAYGEAPGDLAHVTVIAERVRDTVSLGLERLISPDGPLQFPDGDEAAEGAATMIRIWPLRDVFRHGHALVAGLQRSARALAEDPVIRHWIDTADSEMDDYGPERLDRELMRALLEPRPLHGGYDRLRPELRKAFGSWRELREAERRLDAVAERFG